MNKLKFYSRSLHNTALISIGALSLMFTQTATAGCPNMQQSQTGLQQRLESNQAHGKQGGYKTSQLIGQEVKTDQGESLGIISELVINESGQVEHVILTTVAPWQALQSQGDHYVLDTSQLRGSTGAQAQGMARQDEFPRQLSEAFAQLDENQDGYISKEESRRWEALYGGFNQADQNQNDKINQSEFSAFITMEKQNSGATQQSEGQ